MGHASSSSYTCAIFAMSTSVEELTTTIDAVIVQADSRDSAEAEAMTLATKQWPTSEGWFGHLVKARPVIIKSRFAAMMQGDISTREEERIM